MTTTTAIASRDLARILCRASVLRLNSSTLHTLCILHALDGAATMTALARKLGISTAAVTGVADSLEAAGLIARYLSRTDRRLVYVHLTDQGRLTLSDILNA
jgi:DNA-binding MarR family transcriptional regulator